MGSFGGLFRLWGGGYVYEEEERGSTAWNERGGGGKNYFLDA